MKAYNALANITGGLPAADIYLEKIVPDGAGLGGGSADAAYTLIGLNEVFNLGLSKEQLAQTAALIGADCPFFIYSRPAYCSGTGTEISFDVAPHLTPYSILVAKPRVAGVSTAQAYAGVTPRQPLHDIRQTISLSPEKWQGLLKNDFEQSVFAQIPRSSELKTKCSKGSRICFNERIGLGCLRNFC